MRFTTLTLIFLFSSPLFSDFFPKSIHSVIETISDKKITLLPPLKNGMSGVIIHNYGRGISAITSKIVQLSSGKVKKIKTIIAPHDTLPSINTSIQVGDYVIGGYLYENVLLIAPNAQSYLKKISLYAKKWIHPDLFALYLARENESVPTRTNLKHFSEKYQVGLIYIIRKNDEILLDPVSGKIVSKQIIKSSEIEAKSPFYMRFKTLDNSWFYQDKLPSYYNIVEKI